MSIIFLKKGKNLRVWFCLDQKWMLLETLKLKKRFK